MALFKCKMCGGTLEVAAGENVGTCQHCGTRQTLPRLDDDRRANLYDRADHFRRNNEYDKAAGIYETILNEDKTDAEAYWSLVLCEYGVEYVEDTKTHRRIPTCNRTLYASILADENYKQAIANADGAARSLYESEAKAIDAIQKGILDISGKEAPFDIFICYKEADAAGRRTPESVLAQDLYHQLTGEGYKVFFSRITLEDKAGAAYEPYIFAALQSARIMVVIGTRPEHFNAVWVKNEWSRYLALIKSGAPKTLIPAYRDMDPYDLPEEFSHLQALDMSKLGFMQDLMRGIGKLLDAGAPPAPAAAPASAVVAGAEPLVRRAFLLLEDGEWEKADQLLEQALNLDPENARAYIGKLCAALKINSESQLAAMETPSYTETNYWKRALQFADEDYRATLTGYVKTIEDRIEKAAEQEREDRYEQALAGKNNIETVESSDGLQRAANEYAKYSEMFKSLSGFRDADALADECDRLAAECLERVEYTLRYEKALAKKNSLDTAGSSDGLRRAANEYAKYSEMFKSLSGFRDADALADECDRLAAECLEQEREDRYEQALAGKNSIDTAGSSADPQLAAYRYASYSEMFKSLSGFRDADALAAECVRLAAEWREKAIGEKERLREQTIKIAFVVGIVVLLVCLVKFWLMPAMDYASAEKRLAAGEYASAAKAFQELGDYKDARAKAKEAGYAEAERLLAAGEYASAAKAFQELGDYKDARAKAKEAGYAEAERLLAAGEYASAAKAFLELGDYKDARAKATEAIYAYAEEQLAAGKYRAAWQAFEVLGDYKDAKAKAEEAKSKLYAYAEEQLAAGKYWNARWAFDELGYYKDAKAKATEAWNRFLMER